MKGRRKGEEKNENERKKTAGRGKNGREDERGKERSLNEIWDFILESKEWWKDVFVKWGKLNLKFQTG